MARSGRKPGVRRLRGAVKLMGFAVATAIIYPTHLLSVPVLIALGLPGERWSACLFRAWSRWVSRSLGMRLEVEGRPPEAPFFLVSNHLSYVDVVVLASQADCVFVARSDVNDWPVFGALCRLVGTVFVSRESGRQLRRELEGIDGILRRGRGVALFPEGTSSGGETVLPFRSALLETAARGGLEVSYATIRYETPPGAPPAGTAVCWWGERTFLGHLVNLFRLPGFRARLRFGEGTVREADRKVLAARLHHAVLEQFHGMEGGVPARANSDRLCAGSAGVLAPLAGGGPGEEPPSRG